MTEAVIGYDRRMVRWEPDARGRLQEAALDLFLERGYEATTVASIAERAGVTERTFYRHFADKREVLFPGQDVLGGALRDAIAGAEPDAPWMAVVEGALVSLDAFFSAQRRAWSRRRQQAIDADAELREREQLKLAALAETAAEAFAARGLAPTTARLAAETALALFKVAFADWVARAETRDFAELARTAVAGLRAA
jgi:AcrR family transcriptional regulator